MTAPAAHPDLELTSYLDGELDAPACAEIQAHVRDCAECGARLAELRAVVDLAATLVDRAPAVDLWSGIAQRIGAPDASPAPVTSLPRIPAIARRFSFSLPQLAVAAAVVVAVSAGAAWWTSRTLAPPAPAAGTPTERAAATPAVEASTADFEIRNYDRAVTDLQQVLVQNRSRLDPETIKTVETNLAVIDAAIAQARKALAADPANPYLSGHLADQMKRKIRVLQRTAEIVTADYSGGGG